MLSNVIKQMRISSGLSQEQLAKLIGVAQPTLSGYETGYSIPNYTIVEQIASACEFEIAFIDKNNGQKIKTK